jgi:tetratricopeptide (TPR) repeat protein
MGGQVSTPDKKRPLPPASESSDEGFEETKDAAAAVEKVKVPLSSEATVVAARRAFLEGNQMFRESKFSAAQQCYETALRILREHFVTPEQVRDALALLLAHIFMSFHAQQLLQLRTCRAGAHGAATALTNLGVLEFSVGRYDEAKRLLTEALALRQQEGLSAASVAAHVTAPANLCVGMDALEGLDSLAIELSRNRVFWQAPVQHQVRELPLSRAYNTYCIAASCVPPPPPPPPPPLRVRPWPRACRRTPTWTPSPPTP